MRPGWDPQVLRALEFLFMYFSLTRTPAPARALLSRYSPLFTSLPSLLSTASRTIEQPSPFTRVAPPSLPLSLTARFLSPLLLPSLRSPLLSPTRSVTLSDAREGEKPN